MRRLREVRQEWEYALSLNRAGFIGHRSRNPLRATPPATWQARRFVSAIRGGWLPPGAGRRASSAAPRFARGTAGLSGLQSLIGRKLGIWAASSGRRAPPASRLAPPRLGRPGRRLETPTDRLRCRRRRRASVPTTGRRTGWLHASGLNGIGLAALAGSKTITTTRHRGQDRLRQVPVRIDDAHASAGLDVRPDEAL